MGYEEDEPRNPDCYTHSDPLRDCPDRGYAVHNWCDSCKVWMIERLHEKLETAERLIQALAPVEPWCRHCGNKIEGRVVAGHELSCPVPHGDRVEKDR